MCNTEGELLELSNVILRASSHLENKIKAIHHDLKKAYEVNFKEVILETDNLDAFKLLKSFPHNVSQEVSHTVKQIFIGLNDPRLRCVIVYLYHDHNMLAIYLEKLGGERCKLLYTFTRAIGAIEELLSLDLGFGHATLNSKILSL